MQTSATLPGVEAPDPAAGRAVLVFDFLSHETMHLPFNEGYLRMLRAAFPADRIVFHARPGHIASLAAAVSDLPGLAFEPCAPLTVPFGLSPHNPLAGRPAAWGCFTTVARAARGAAPRLVALLGVDANLLGVARRRAPSLSAPLHLIMHAEVGRPQLWRSRNPLFRAGDILSVMRRGVPPSVRMVALELGVAAAVSELAPALRPNLVTLEHPILRREWMQDRQDASQAALKIGFLGNADLVKGFGIFTEVALACRGRADLEFEAIGIATSNSERLDQSGLSRRPTPGGLPRDAYVQAVQRLDLACLPMSSRAYDLIASGTVSDAIAALKPLLALRTRTLAAIADKYGPIGMLADSKQQMIEALQDLTPESFAQRRAEWVANLRRLRAARLPESVAQGYAALVA